MNITTNEKLNHIVEKTRDIFKKDEYIQPITFLFDKDNNGTVLHGFDFSNDITKDMFSFVIKKICNEKQIVELFLVVESWVKEFKCNKESFEDEYEDFKDRGKRVSEYDDKKEVIMILHETKLSSDLYFIPVIRFGNNVKLGKLEKMKGITGEGRFSGFLYSKDLDKTIH